MKTSVGPVTLSGPGWVKSAAFRTMRLTEQLGEPFHYELDVLSDKDEIPAGDVLGEALTVSLEVGEEPRHFNAFATELIQLGRVGSYEHYRVVLRPWIWFLSRTANCRIFQDMSVLDIVKSVFREHGFADFEERLSESYDPRVYVVQYRETDLAFVQRLLEHEGIYFFFEHTKATHTLVLCDALTAHEPTPFYAGLPLLASGSGTKSHLPFITDWSMRHAVEPGAVALSDFDFEKPSANLLVSKENPASHPHAKYELYDSPGSYTETGPGEAYAARRLEEAQAGNAQVEGSSNARGLMVGATFTLQQHPVAAHNKAYLVTVMTGMLGSHAMETGGGALGDVFECRFEAIDAQKQFRAPRVTPRPIVHGTQTATVVGPEGEEIWTDKHGRVKLQFHWDRDGKRDEKSSCWVRVAQIWAGSGFGAMYVPRIGQEVVVDFMEGDPDQPIVTGRVYNGDNAPPYELPKNQTQSGIKSRSSKGGGADNCNEIRFEDKSGQEQFFMQAEKDQTINVKNNRSASVGAGDSVSVGGSRSVSVSSNLSVTVGTGGAAESTLNVTGTHKVDASDSIDVQAPNYIKLTCGGSVIEIRPDSITLSAGGGSKLVLDKNGYLESNGKSSLLLDQNACAKASGGASLLLDSNVLAESSAASKLLLDGDASVSSPMNVNVEGTVKVGLSGGGASQVDLEAAGATMSGPKASVSGTAMTEVSGPVVRIN